jgi:hypothetical protein
MVLRVFSDPDRVSEDIALPSGDEEELVVETIETDRSIVAVRPRMPVWNEPQEGGLQLMIDDTLGREELSIHSAEHRSQAHQQITSRKRAGCSY